MCWLANYHAGPRVVELTVWPCANSTTLAIVLPVKGSIGLCVCINGRGIHCFVWPGVESYLAVCYITVINQTTTTLIQLSALNNPQVMYIHWSSQQPDNTLVTG